MNTFKSHFPNNKFQGFFALNQSINKGEENAELIIQVIFPLLKISIFKILNTMSEDHTILNKKSLSVNDPEALANSRDASTPLVYLPRSNRGP